MLVIRHPWIPSLVGFLVAFGLVPIGAPVGVAVAVGIGWAALAWFIATGIRRRMHPIIQERRP